MLFLFAKSTALLIRAWVHMNRTTPRKKKKKKRRNPILLCTYETSVNAWPTSRMFPRPRERNPTPPCLRHPISKPRTSRSTGQTPVRLHVALGHWPKPTDSRCGFYTRYVDCFVCDYRCTTRTGQAFTTSTRPFPCG